jgi:outer membrane protein assembly factor BamD
VALEHGIQLDLLTPDHLVATAADGAVHAHAALADPLLQAATRKVSKELGQGLVEPQSGLGLLDPGGEVRHGTVGHGRAGIGKARIGYTGALSADPAPFATPLMNTARTLILLLLMLTAQACGLLPDEEDKTKGWSAQKLYSEASGALQSGDYQNAIKYYEKLEARYPFGRYAMQAQLDVAYAYYKYDEPESAIAACDRFIKLYPNSQATPYAYYLKGIVNFNRNLGLLERYLPTDPSQRDAAAALEAYKDFEELVRRFPNSDYAKDARQRMLYLNNNLARYEVHVADYYLRRGAYLAAANRASQVVEKFQRTPAVRDALLIMIEAYDRLGMQDLANDARRVVALNDAKGTFATDTTLPTEKSWGKEIWDYLELDKN